MLARKVDCEMEERYVGTFHRHQIDTRLPAVGQGLSCILAPGCVFFSVSTY